MIFIKRLSKRIPAYLFYLFAFLLPWQTRWIFRDTAINGVVFEYGRMSLYLFDILLAILLIYLLYLCYSQDKKQLGIIFISCLLLIVYCFLTLFWSTEKIISLYWSVRILFAIGLFYLIQKINFSRVKLAVIITISAGIQGFLAIFQFLTQSVWGSKWFGIDSQTARELGASVVEFGLERWLRAYGSLPHPNILGGLLVLSLIAVVYLTAKIEYKYHRLFLVASVSLIIPAIIFTYSRATWIGFAIVFITGFIYLRLKFSSRAEPSSVLLEKQKFSQGLWLYGLILIIMFTVATWPIIRTRLNIGPSARLEMQSNTERISNAKQALEIFKNHWLLGSGIGNYTYELQSKYPDLKSWQIQPAHNTYLLVLAELGVVGFIIVSLLHSLIVIPIITRKKRPLLLLGLTVLFILLFFDHYFWTLPTGLYIWFLVLGLALKQDRCPINFNP